MDSLLERAALRIQCVFRCARARRDANTKRRQRQVRFAKEVDDDLAVTAAVTLQAAQRRHAAQKLLLQKRDTHRAADPRPSNDGPPNVPSYASMSSSGFGGRAGLTTAFAMSSVSSYSSLLRDPKQFGDGAQTPALMRECAAVIIQCKWRVHVARKRVKTLRERRKQQRQIDDDTQLQAVAATSIQRTFRGHTVRAATPTLQVRAAVRIQCLFRKRKARREVTTRKDLRAASFAAEVQQSLEQDAARLIQSHQRRLRDEKIVREIRLGRSERSLAPSTGYGLSTLFYSTCGALLEKNSVGRCLFWGVRILHAVAMDEIMEHQGRFTLLEPSRWVQGPLGSIVPLTRSAAKSPRLPTLQR
jgi:hypothetical protein